MGAKSQEPRIKRLRTRRKKSVSVWLVTWEHTRNHVRPREYLAAVLSSRLSAERVRQIVELLYANETFTYGERIAHACGKFNPYPARFSAIGRAPWAGQIFCGHNPFLFARLVEGLRAEGPDPGSRRLVWKDKPRPDLEWLTGQRT